MSFANNLLTGYKIGSNISERWDEKKKKKGMAEAINMASDPDQQNQQEQMLESQTADFAPEDAQKWQPEAKDWVNARLNGAKKITDSGGSLQDVMAFEKMITDKQREGIQRNSAMAADAYDRGDMEAASHYMDNAYGYMDDGVRLQTAAVDGKLMGFAYDEKSDKLINQPIPFKNGNDIRRLAQAYTDNNAFLSWSESRYQFEQLYEARLAELEETKRSNEAKEDENKRSNKAKETIEGAKIERPTNSVASGGGGGGGGGGGPGGAGYGWSKQSEYRQTSNDANAWLDRYDPNSVNPLSIPSNKQDLYGTSDNPNVDGLASVRNMTNGILDVNPNISAQAAVESAEFLTLLRRDPKRYVEYMKKYGSVDPSKPTGLAVEINGTSYGIPLILVPLNQRPAVQQRLANLQNGGGGGGGPVIYQSKPPANLPESFWAEHGGRPGGSRQSGALPVPQRNTSAINQAPAAQAPAAQAPAPAPESAIKPATSDDDIAQNIMTTLSRNVDPQTGELDLDVETIKRWESILKGLEGKQVQRARDLLRRAKEEVSKASQYHAENYFTNRSSAIGIPAGARGSR